MVYNLILYFFNSFFYEGGFNSPKAYMFNFNSKDFFKIILIMMLFSLEMLLMVIFLSNPSNCDFILLIISVLSLQIVIMNIFFGSNE